MRLVDHLNDIIVECNNELEDSDIKKSKMISKRKIMSRRYIRQFFKDLPEDIVEFYTYLGNNYHNFFAELKIETDIYYVDIIHPLRHDKYSVEDNIDTYINDKRMPSWLFPFSGFGINVYVLSTRQEDFGTVYEWYHGLEFMEGEGYELEEYTDNLTKVADSFTDFILKLEPYNEI